MFPSDDFKIIVLNPFAHHFHIADNDARINEYFQQAIDVGFAADDHASFAQDLIIQAGQEPFDFLIDGLRNSI